MLQNVQSITKAIKKKRYAKNKTRICLCPLSCWHSARCNNSELERHIPKLPLQPGFAGVPHWKTLAGFLPFSHTQ